MGTPCIDQRFVTQECKSAKWIVVKNSHCWHNDMGGKRWQLAMRGHGYLYERKGGQGPGLGVLVSRGYFEDLDYCTWTLSNSRWTKRRDSFCIGDLVPGFNFEDLDRHTLARSGSQRLNKRTFKWSSLTTWMNFLLQTCIRQYGLGGVGSSIARRMVYPLTCFSQREAREWERGTNQAPNR